MTTSRTSPKIRSLLDVINSRKKEEYKKYQPAKTEAHPNLLIREEPPESPTTTPLFWFNPATRLLYRKVQVKKVLHDRVSRIKSLDGMSAESAGSLLNRRHYVWAECLDPSVFTDDAALLSVLTGIMPKAQMKWDTFVESL